MRPKVERLRPRHADTVTEAVKLLLDLPVGLTPSSRDNLSDILGNFAPPQSWGFVMLNPEQQRLVVKAINESDKPLLNFRVWTVVISHLRYDTGEIMAGRKRIAKDTGTSPEDVSRALSFLTEIGALVRIGHGRYAINPHVGWQGSLLKRQEAAKHAPLVVVGK